MTQNKVKIIKEGLAHLELPKTVFYNPVQEFNRDLSVLALKTYIKNNLWRHKQESSRIEKRGGLKILDALSASGLRSIRYAKELDDSIKWVKTIVANDLSDSAVEMIRKNINANQVENKVVCSHSNAITVLNNSTLNWDDTFHVIDLDPFGSGSQFFDSAVRTIGNAGLLMVTCTDTAVLCGNSSEACFARYGAMSLKTRSCHEMALRIILKSLESHAAVYGRYIKPLLSVSVDFYVRLFVQVFENQGETRKSASKMSLVYLCRECETFEFNAMGRCKVKPERAKKVTSINPNTKYDFKPAEALITDRCQICGGRKNLGGPIWAGFMHDPDFLKLLLQEIELPATKEKFGTFKRIEGIVNVCNEELGLPLMFNLDDFASCLKSGSPPYKTIASALLNAGYKASQSHTSRGGFKTDAPNSVVWDIFCQYADKNSKKSDDSVESLKTRIMRRVRKTDYDFTYNQNCETKSKKLSLMRFQRNPTPFWGPKSKPSSRQDDDDNDNDGNKDDKDQIKEKVCSENRPTNESKNDSDATLQPKKLKTCEDN